jgi:hypothetical protein
VNRLGVNLLAEVAAVLRRQHAPFAVIGAAALAVHGVSRGTRDLDLFTVDPGCLAPEFWQDLAGSGVEVSVRGGDADDPLAGVVRFTRPGAAPVDLVVGRSRWQERIAASAIEGRIEGVSVPVARPPDLVLLKLYAGGPQDAWDIAQLITGPGASSLIDEVEHRLEALPEPCRQLWARIRAAGA